MELYKKLFREQTDGMEDRKALLEKIIIKKISVEQEAMLSAVVTDVEIQKAVFAIKDEKAPGPDGYKANFFKRNWSLVVKDVIAAIRYCFDNNYMYEGLNSTVLSLVPKSKNANSMQDFRPIACCTVLYKRYYHILTNRIKEIDLIKYSQSAFLKNKNISDNIMLIHEVVHGYNRGGVKSRCVFKIDIMKAYDTINWDFLFTVMRVMNFLDQFIKRIKLMTTTEFSMNLNGSMVGYFSSEKGFKQGTPCHLICFC